MQFRKKIRIATGGLVQLLGVSLLLASGCLAAGSQLGGNPAVNGANEVLATAKRTSEPGSAELLLAGALLLSSAAIGRKINKRVLGPVGGDERTLIATR